MKQWLNDCWTMATLDYRQKMRQKSTLATIIFFMFFTYFCFPDKSSPYNYTIALNNEAKTLSARGTYNSDWMGVLIIVYFSLILLLGGIYLIRKTLRRDQLSGYGDLMASSNVRKSVFFEAKRLSNFLYLSTLMFTVVVLAVIVQLIRQEVTQVSIMSYLLPYLIVILPFTYLLGTLALIFEAVPGLKGSFGNLAVMILGVAALSLAISNVDNSNNVSSVLSKLGDISGQSYVLEQVQASFHSAFGMNSTGFAIFSNNPPYTDFFTFKFNWESTFILSRLLLVFLSFGLLYLVQVLVPLKSVFMTKDKRLNKSKKRPATKEESQLPVFQGKLSADKVVIKPVSLMTLFYFQLLTLLREQKKGVLLLLAALISQWLPLSASVGEVLWMAITIMPIFIWSRIGLKKEEDYLKTTIAFPQGIIWSNLLSHWLLWLLYFSGTITKLLLVGNLLGAVGIALTAIMLVSFAYACNRLVHNDMLFEAIFIIIWYIEIIQKLPIINLFNQQPSSYLPSLVLLLIAILSTAIVQVKK